MNEKLCNCCGNEQTVFRETFNEFKHIKCKNCGYEYFSRQYPEINAQLYENDADYNDDLEIAADFTDLLQWSHKKAVRFLSQRYPSGKATILDIGCFNGFFVKKLIECRFDAFGIDFNNKALEFGKQKYDLLDRISANTVQNLIKKNVRFDAITLFEVIEHLENPYALLQDAAMLIKDKGIIIISTPNSKMCWRPDLDFPPHHLSRFTPESLNSCISRLGLKSVQLHEQMSSFDLCRNYAGTFFRHKDRASLRGGEFKNKALSGMLRRCMNKTRGIGNCLLSPVDAVLHAVGLRYICQLLIAEKIQ